MCSIGRYMGEKAAKVVASLWVTRGFIQEIQHCVEHAYSITCIVRRKSIKEVSNFKLQ